MALEAEDSLCPHPSRMIRAFGLAVVMVIFLGNGHLIF
jgi:hypothetical protein